MAFNAATTPPRKPGLTLAEMLCALAILVVIGAVVLPWTIQWLGGRELDNAEDQIAMQMMMARAAAREEGRPVEVIADGANGVKARWLRDEEALDDASSGAESDPADGGATTGIGADWAALDLPSGVRIQIEDDDETGSGETRMDATDASGGGERATSRGGGAIPQTLAIFLPDGTAILAPIFMLRTDGGVARAMRVDRSTGRPREIERDAPAFRSSPDPFRDRLDGGDETIGTDVDQRADDALEDAARETRPGSGSARGGR